MGKHEQAVLTPERVTGPGRAASSATGAPASGQKPGRGFLGVIVDGFDLGGRPGVSVVGTYEGSPAARIGLATGDRIVSIGGAEVATAASLGDVISTRAPGDQIVVAWWTPSGTVHLREVRLSKVSGPPRTRARHPSRRLTPTPAPGRWARATPSRGPELRGGVAARTRRRATS